ncbi:MAG: surface protein [Bacteroidia bacterium]|nr:MAG: surface protein [Bacteroidia bacterium]
MVRTVAKALALLVAVIGIAARSASVAGESDYTAIAVVPQEIYLYGPRAVQRVVVMGTLPDGTTKQITQGLEYTIENPAIAGIENGMVRPRREGSTTLVVTFGSLTARATVRVEAMTDQVIDFQRDVLPVLSKAGCNITGCHGSPRGKNGFRLSLFGAEPDEDAVALARDRYSRLVNPVEPEKSLYLLKATATIAHGGGKRLDKNTDEYRLLVEWIRSGAPLDRLVDVELERLSVFPEEFLCEAGQQQQILVTAHYSDGTVRDVTHLATYTSTESSIATVDEQGLVTTTGTGEAVIVIGYGGKFATARFLVPQELPVPFPDLKPNNRIDELVFAKLRKLNIPPSDLASDEMFLRRVYLDTIGTLPTPDEVRQFLSDPDPNKRARVIDELLSREEFVDFWTLKWCDLLRVKPEFPIQLWPKGVAAFYRWIRQSIAENKPYDQFVRELITASGDRYRNGAANYYRATSMRDPQSWAEMTATTFLGIRIDCARCHSHPFEAWTWDDNLGLAAFFQVGLKRTPDWGNEVVYWNPAVRVRHPKTGEVVQPRFLGGQQAEIPQGKDPREVLAEWLTSPDNPWFARAIVNRVWYWLLGRGIVHEPDDFRVTNPPENPELLDYLASELISHNWDLKHIFRLILNSKVYQLSSIPNKWNAHDTTHFSHYPPQTVDSRTAFGCREPGL